MATKSNRETTQWQPPQGIRYYERAGRPNPYLLQWRVDGKRKTLAFKTEAGREGYAKDLASKIMDHGQVMLNFDPNKWRVWLAFEERANGIDPLRILAEWQAGAGKSQQSPKVETAIANFRRAKLASGAWGTDMGAHRKRQLARLGEAFAGRPMHTVSTAEVRAWLDALPTGQHSRRDHRKAVGELYRWAMAEGLGVTTDPTATIAPPRIIEDDPVIITPEQARAYFTANQDQPFIARVALEAFGGVRYSTAGQMTKADIDFDRKGLRLRAAIHKTGKRDGKSRYRQGHPEALWRWLANATNATWEMSLLEYREAKRDGWIRAGITGIDVRNIWRHSFISYHLAAYANPPLTQRLAQHSTAAQTEEYEGTATREDAEGYFAI